MLINMKLSTVASRAVTDLQLGSETPEQTINRLLENIAVLYTNEEIELFFGEQLPNDGSSIDWRSGQFKLNCEV